MEINVLAIIVSWIVLYGLGALWYGPFFGKQWMKLAKPEEAHMQKTKDKTGLMYTLGGIQFLIIVIAVAVLFSLFKVDSFGDAIVFGLLSWTAYIGAISVGDILWLGKRKKLWLLNNAYYLIGFLLVSIILALW